MVNLPQDTILLLCTFSLEACHEHAQIQANAALVTVECWGNRSLLDDLLHYSRLCPGERHHPMESRQHYYASVHTVPLVGHYDGTHFLRFCRLDPQFEQIKEGRRRRLVHWL